MAAILIIEEDSVLAQQMARTLRRTGHFPILASNAQSALRGGEERPDVILLDLELPEVPGTVVLDRLQRQPKTAPIPVLAITWNRRAALRLRAAGRVAEVLRKPLSGVHLREAVDRVVGRHR